MTINLTLNNKDFKKLENIAKNTGKSIQELASNVLHQYSVDIERIKNDPLYQMEGYDSNAPTDLAANHDYYLYGK